MVSRRKFLAGLARVGTVAAAGISLVGCGRESLTSPSNPEESHAHLRDYIAGIDDATRNAIAALYLGKGPYATENCTDTSCSENSRYNPIWEGMPKNTHVKVLLTENMKASMDTRVASMLGQISAATRGMISGSVQRTGNYNQEPDELYQVKIIKYDNEIVRWPHGGALRFNNAKGTIERACIMYSAAIFESATAEYSRWLDRGLLHELCHSILGLYHINWQAPIGDISTMGYGIGCSLSYLPISLSPMDVRAAELVFTSKIEPGDNEGKFRAAGLII